MQPQGVKYIGVADGKASEDDEEELEVVLPGEDKGAVMGKFVDRWSRCCEETMRTTDWQLVIKGRGCLQELNRQDPAIIHIPANKDNLDWLLDEDTGFQAALAGYDGDISIHYPKHKLWAEMRNLPLKDTTRCQHQPVKDLMVSTDASGRSKKAVVTWVNPATGLWEQEIQTMNHGSVQVLELAAIPIALELFSEQPVNIVRDSCYAAGLVSCLEASFL
ncbi:hypothetical protein BTVI_00815 [Pitangus sulphuratus]|nr:hypothetical protein BTVI_00815 [Pitangus sulphuratus]